MDVLEAIVERRSIRAFLDQAVPQETLLAILEAAKWAPSGVNTQPWHVAIVGQETRKKIAEAIIAKMKANVPKNPDYQYYPQDWFDPFKTRRKACGSALYGALNISHDDTEKRKAQWYRNYYFFDAPAGMMFFIDNRLETGSWLDMGMFLQNVMLAARGYGLETCPQAALAEYPEIIRDLISPPPNHAVVCGMALGYPDWSHPVNQYRTAREPLDAFVQVID
ncbi:MAG: nitroreductase family protein [Gammaproteobacteria bacterium]